MQTARLIIVAILTLSTSAVLADDPTATPTATAPSKAMALGSPFPSPFQDVVIETKPSFAHDYGVTVQILKISVDGVVMQRDAVVGALVKKWNGWNPKGDRTEAAAKATVLAFARHWQRLIERRPLVNATAPYELKNIIDVEPAFGPYSAPTASVIDIGGERVVVAVLFAQGPIGKRTMQFDRVVLAHQLADGAPVKLDATSPLRESATGSVGGGRRPRTTLQPQPNQATRRLGGRR